MSSKINSYFIAGTNTNVGKTVITGLLAKFFITHKKKTCITQKWVQTGPESDIKKHLEVMENPLKTIGPYQQAINPYVFSLPASPHFAAEYEKKTIKEEKILTAFHALKHHFDMVIVEGCGGLLVPFSTSLLQIDLLEKLKIPTILVAENRLGTLNHTLLSVEALKIRQIPIAGIILNDIEKKTPSNIMKNNTETLKAFIPNKIPIICIKHKPDPKNVIREFIPYF